MTLPYSLRRAGPFNGTGALVAFPFTFKVFAKTDVSAQLTVNGVTTTLVQDSDYTVTLNVDQNATPGGDILYTLAVGATLTLLGSLPYDQPADLPAGGAYRAQVVEDALDRVVIQAQQLAESADRSLRAPIGEVLATLPNRAARASTVMGFDSNGNPSVAAPLSGTAADVLVQLADASNAARGDAQIAVKRTVADAVATTQHAVHETRVFDLKADFGAVGDGVADDSAAFAKAYKAALSFYGATSLSAGTLYVPPGTYLITTDNFLGNLDFTTLTGGFDTRRDLTILGAGWGSVLLWKPSSVSADVWMYDQGTSGTPKNHLINATLQNLAVVHDVANLSGGAKANGFRLLGTSGSNGVVQGFRFLNTRFSILGYGNPITTATRAKCGTFMRIGGSVNASEMVWTDSLIQAYLTVLDIAANGEAVNHNFNNTSCELIFGDVFKIAAGHSVNVRGGSWILESETASYLLAIRQGSVSITGAFLFEGGRTELRVNSLGTYLSGWFLCDATGFPNAYQSSFPTVKFLGWTSKASGSARNTFVIDAAMPVKITIDGCSVGDTGATQVDRVSVNSSKAGLQAANTLWWMSELDFINGDAVLFDNVSFTNTNSTARISSRNSRNSIDYDLTANGVCDQVKGRARPLKTATIWGTAWPDLGNNSTMQLKLPKGALLKKAMFRKAANGGATTAGYRLAMVDGASNQYCASASANQNTEHKALTDNLNIYLDDALGYVAGISASQTVFLIALAGNLGSAQAVPMAATDYAVVEYL